MQKSTPQKIRLGIFVIIGLIVFIAAVYFIGNQQNLFGKTFKVKAIFRNISGLQVGNNVRYSGVNVGTVSDITLISDTDILVQMVLDEKIRPHIRKDVIATVSTDGLVGSMIINIVPGEGKQPMVESGDTIKSYTRISAADMLNTLNVTNENAALLTADLLKVVRSVNEGKGTLGILLNDTTMATDLKETLANLKQTSIRTTEAMDKINHAIENLNQDTGLAGLILNDTATTNQFKNIITDLQSFSEGLNGAVADVNKLIGGIKDTKGPINAAIYDSVLVKDLDQSMGNINTATERFNELMEALKHNFLFRNYFRKKEQGKLN